MRENRKSDTIAAVATAMNNAGIGIIRVSGDRAISVVDEIFRSAKTGKTLSNVPTHTIHYGTIWDEDRLIDEVLVMVMHAPHSYTAEDTVEIDSHGGILVMQKILEAVVHHGARIAEPGEFTKRAFLNGRIDLAQAEAVMDTVQAGNEYALQSSVSQLRGSVSRRVRALREALIYQIAYIESALDDPEHISLEGYTTVLEEKLAPMLKELEEMVNSADDGRIMSEGVRTVILGKPNAGKSSLMNALLGEDRAIVTDIAGTTRDTLEEEIRLRDVNLHIIDTAGIRATDDIIEQMGVERARQMADRADLIIYVADGSRPLDTNDAMIMELIQERKAIVLLNKNDLELTVSREELEEKTGRPVIAVSAKEETGIDELGKAVEALFYSGKLDFNNQVVITNMRHKEALSCALESLRLVVQGIHEGMPEDVLTIDMMDAYSQLGSIIGESVGDDLVNEIFGRFCMGK
ncbi:MAG: tRNA uridine-5-carboxymethylaminomethyl(34) synthesis GTPase MnmE [Clostridiales bacterium]|nr:tRNA uridine-5-carboxymethylaminomethyl(34) synthesis GTPase MnmE [Clostridiales bacterium]